jgi:hypothetical protein
VFGPVILLMDISQSMPIIGPDSNCFDAEMRVLRPTVPVVLVAAVALIDIDGRILLAQRPEGKKLSTARRQSLL